MSKQNFVDGQELTLQDLNSIQSRQQKVLFDRIAYELIKRAEDCFFPNSHEVTRVDNNTVSVSPGVGFQTTVEPLSDQPVRKLLFLENPETLNIATPDATNARIDVIVAQAQEVDSETEDRRIKSASDDNISENSVVVAKDWLTSLSIIEGTPDPSPTAPMVPAGFVAIAQIVVDPGAGISAQANIFDERTLVTVGAVESVAGKTGVVLLDSSDVGLENVANKSENDLVTSGPIANALSQKANLTALALVATTGDYDDLLNKPTIGGNAAGQIAIGDGVQTVFNLNADPGNQANLVIVIDGVTQIRDTWSLSGTTVTFTTAPPLNTKIQFTYGNAINIGTPADDTVSSLKITEAAKNELSPLGSVVAFAGQTAPSKWAICDGSAVSRTTFSDLFSVIGTFYGVGDGSTTFNLPDLRGEFIRGMDNGRGVDSGRVIATPQADATAVNGLQMGNAGSASGSFSFTDNDSTQMRVRVRNTSGVFGSSSNNANYHNSNGVPSAQTLPGQVNLFIPSHTHVLSSIDFETRPRNLAMNFIMKVEY